MDYKQELIKNFKSCGYKYDVNSLFTDWCLLTFYNLNLINDRSENLNKIKEITRRYDNQTNELFQDIFNNFIAALEQNPFEDVLGHVYMRLELGKKGLAQCFTPNSIAEVMAKIVLNKQQIEQQINEKGFITVSDCCVGGGVMVLEAAKCMKDLGYNPQKDMLVVANDVDMLAVAMTYIQLTLNGIPAVVYKGDTITHKMEKRYNTLMYYMGNYFKFERFMNDKESNNIEKNQETITNKRRR